IVSEILTFWVRQGRGPKTDFLTPSQAARSDSIGKNDEKSIFRGCHFFGQTDSFSLGLAFSHGWTRPIAFPREFRPDSNFLVPDLGGPKVPFLDFCRGVSGRP